VPLNEKVFSEFDFLPITITDLPSLRSCCLTDTNLQSLILAPQTTVATKEFGPILRICRSRGPNERLSASVSQAVVKIREHGTAGWITTSMGTAGSALHMETQITQKCNEEEVQEDGNEFQSLKGKCNEQM
jgi:hypothetical protein